MQVISADLSQIFLGQAKQKWRRGGDGPRLRKVVTHCTDRTTDETFHLYTQSVCVYSFERYTITNPQYEPLKYNVIFALSICYLQVYRWQLSTATAFRPWLETALTILTELTNVTDYGKRFAQFCWCIYSETNTCEKCKYNYMVPV